MCALSVFVRILFFNYQTGNKGLVGVSVNCIFRYISEKSVFSQLSKNVAVRCFSSGSLFSGT